ncbi:hypothetical protein MBLNU230_g8136t1 [Neophaeotheca triangularis]
MAETKYFEKEITLSPNSSPAGSTFPAKLAYWTFGSPSNPAILLPTCYGGSLASTFPFLYDGPDAPLPSSKFYIIVVGLLSGGESSSPSNTPSPHNGPNFPHVTYEDNIHLQRALCSSLGILNDRLFAYIGFSMGCQQAYHMSVLYPDFVQNAICIAGSARTSSHNWSFLEGPRHALTMSADYHGGYYAERPVMGLTAFFHTYSTWALSQGWFRQKCWEQLGFGSLKEYLEAWWTPAPGSGRGGSDANDLLWLLETWQKGDVTLYNERDGGEGDVGDLGKALGKIKAKVLVMPSRTDQYFPPEDSEIEVGLLEKGEFSCIETVWGHMAGGGNGSKEDTEFIKKEVRRFLGV